MLGGKGRFELSSSVREVVFGLEDSLVSTLGTVSGVAVGSGQSQTVVLAGIILVFVEALSMAAGSYLSSKSTAQVFSRRENRELKAYLKERGLSGQAIDKAVLLATKDQGNTDAPVLAGAVMGLFYIFGGALVLSPYLFLPLNLALLVAIGITVVSLVILGFWRAKLSQLSVFKTGFEMVMVSLVACGVGIALGKLLNSLLVTGI